MEKEMQHIYQEIAETVNKMIPEEWHEFYFYAQVSDTGAGVYFFYNTPENKSKYQYSLDIPEDFNLDEDEFDEVDDYLYKLGYKMRDVFKRHNQDLWYSFTMHVNASGKLNVNYDYTNWFELDYDLLDEFSIWKYKYLGEESSDPKERKALQKYLEEYPDNPILKILN